MEMTKNIIISIYILTSYAFPVYALSLEEFIKSVSEKNLSFQSIQNSKQAAEEKRVSGDVGAFTRIIIRCKLHPG
jgi:hypothetical protein